MKTPNGLCLICGGLGGCECDEVEQLMATYCRACDGIGNFEGYSCTKCDGTGTTKQQSSQIHLYAAGRGCYMESGSAVGLLYEVDTHRRWDWGFVEIALERGDIVHIRPANAQEFARIADLMQSAKRDAIAAARLEGYQRAKDEERFKRENAQRPPPKKRRKQPHSQGHSK